MTTTVQERFWGKVDKSAGPGGCWLWTAGLRTGDHGQFHMEGRDWRPHRLALEWAAGPCPPGLVACHSCQNRRCVNPAHLSWKTKAANRASSRSANATQELFWAKVDKGAGPDGCWLWTAFINEDGYGRFWISGRHRLAHRVVLEWTVGPCPLRSEACHSCRNRHCVNPAHLRWDTTKSNQRDRFKDGTDSRGERHPMVKLTAVQVLEIRAAVAGGESQRSVARRYGVTQALVSCIARRHSWKHLPEVAA